MSRKGSLLKKLKQNQRQGSKPDCHWLTHGSQVASQLTALTEPRGSVSVDDCWMPKGFGQIEEAQLHRATRPLQLQDCRRLATGGCRYGAVLPDAELGHRQHVHRGRTHTRGCSS